MTAEESCANCGCEVNAEPSVLCDACAEPGGLSAGDAVEVLAVLEDLKEWASNLRVRITQKEQRAGLAIFRRANIAITKARGGK